MPELVNDTLELQLKQLIVQSLQLEDIQPEAIVSADPLFRDGLGLDSIDALELSMAIHKRFGVRIAADDERNKVIFHSVRSLAAFIDSQRQSN